MYDALELNKFGNKVIANKRNCLKNKKYTKHNKLTKEQHRLRQTLEVKLGSIRTHRSCSSCGTSLVTYVIINDVTSLFR